MRVLSAEESRAFDRRATETIGVPDLVLMENAALAVVEALVARYPGAGRIGVLCGPGNNGGDGFAIARQLLTRGLETVVLSARFGSERSTSCARQAAIVEALGVPIGELEEENVEGGLRALEACDALVDALFGVGLSRPLAGPWARLVEGLPRHAPVVAVDLPSGLDADRPAPIGPLSPASLTVTFVAPKPAHVLDPSCDACGEVVVADLGVPFVGDAGPGALHLLVGEELAHALPRRLAAAHKGDFGHVLVVAGSAGKAGAMVLAARASVAGGAGLTTVALPEPLAAALAGGCPEAMSLPLPAGEDGTLAAVSAARLVAEAEKRDVLAIGPGLGRDAATDSLVRDLVVATHVPLVLDADGLNAFAGRLDELAGRRGPSVLTPHPGELARLLGRTVPEVQDDRLAAAREAARRSGATVVLKGRRTVIASSDGEAWVNPTGGPEMATGGSGDVLTGLLAARLAQGDEPEFAACLSVHLHGLAGELAAERLGGPAVPASELLVDLPGAYGALDEDD